VSACATMGSPAEASPHFTKVLLDSFAGKFMALCS
jgi:hypothetical protein